MQFDSVASFLDMGGYGFYVWLSFGSGALLLATLTIGSNLAHKRIKAQIAQQLKRESKLKQAAELRAKEANNES
ncbi:heme exporter protein CcmD [Thalassotalea euphylliae]|uniref:heme exporter protein CcmD n=1 Tax=Thalassotalea euphylliae TaxID=1655234 RepID=UPI003644E39B